MGRPKKYIHEPKHEVKEEVKAEVKAPVQEAPKPVETVSKEAQLLDQQNLVAQLDVDKANKDMLLKTAREVHDHIVRARAELQRVNTELENKYRTLTQVDNEIKSQLYIQNRQGEKFQKDNAEQIRLLDVKQKAVEASDAEYKRISLEVTALKNKLGNDLEAIKDERRTHVQEIGRMTRHVADIESESSKTKADIAEREEKLKAEKDAFETEKESLMPELAKISAVKNENLLLWQKIEAAQADVERQKGAMDNYKAKLDADASLAMGSITRLEQKLKNEEAKMRKWEQDLKDFDLELKARESEAQKMRKRYELQEVVKSGKPS